MEELSEEKIKKLDEQAKELIEEFYSHLDSVKKLANEGEVIDARLVYEGWAIQKIANLQVIIFDLVEKIHNLRIAVELMNKERK